MHRNEALIREVLKRATGANIHWISGLIAKYRLAMAVGDLAGAAAAEESLRRYLSNRSHGPLQGI